eukprot:NODE_17_length_41373_cov_0.337016.p1 type:complete len:905 gc:universal NODE_17_length_41373_cov_0.337016:20216-22930(+)
MPNLSLFTGPHRIVTHCMSKNQNPSTKLQILLNRVQEKDFKASMEVEAFASQSTVEELFDAYKQVDLRVKKSSKELERYYYNNYYSFIESAREQIDTTKLLEHVNSKLANQYIPIIEEINSSFEGIREQLADELLRYEQLKKYSIAKKQSGWVVDLFVNLEKSFHRIKGSTPLNPKECSFKDINYKIYGYIIRCAYHIKNYYLLSLFSASKNNPEIKSILSKCSQVVVRIARLIESMLTTHTTWCGSWSLEYPILLLVHSFLSELNIPSEIGNKIQSKLPLIFQFYTQTFSFTNQKYLNMSTNEEFVKMRNLVLRDVCLFGLTLNAFYINMEPITSDSTNVKIIYNHLYQIRQLTCPVECESILLTLNSFYTPLMDILVSSTVSCYSSLLICCIKKDYLGENFNSNKLVHLLRNIKAECHEAAIFPFDFLWSVDKSAPVKVDENVVILQLLETSQLVQSRFPLTEALFANLSSRLMAHVVLESIRYSFLEVRSKLQFALEDCLKFITVQFSSKQLATGLLETERVLEKTLNDVVRKQLKKIRRFMIDGNEPIEWFSKAVLDQLHDFWRHISDSSFLDCNSQLILSRVCFDSDMHLINNCFIKFLVLIHSTEFEEEEEPSTEMIQYYNSLNFGVSELRENVRIQAKQKLGHYILHHCLHLTGLMGLYFNDLDHKKDKIIISTILQQSITYIKDIEVFASVIFDELGKEDYYTSRPPVAKKGHAKTYSLDDRFSDRESASSTGISPTKVDSKSVVLTAPRLYSSHVHKLFRKHVDYYPQLPTTIIKNELKVRVDFTKEAIIEHLLLVIIKHMIEGIKNRCTLFYCGVFTSQQYEQIYIDVEYLKMIIRLSASKLESSVMDDKFLMILLDEARSYAFANCPSPRSPDTKYMQQILEEERIKLSKTAK